ncbi:MAG TPA: hypothetical protein VF720_16230 [Candidatus Eisenbacteria bacterium]
MKLRGRSLSWLLLLFLAACGEDSPAPPVDSEAPVIQAVSPGPWARVSGTTSLSIQANGARRFAYSVDDGTPVESATSPIAWNSADVLNGPHGLRLIASNGAGDVDTTIFLVCDNPGRGTAVLISPREVTVEPNAEYQFEAMLLGGVPGGVTWSLVAPGDGVDWGQIDANGMYTAPNGLPSPPTVTVLARSVDDPGKASTARITIAGVAVRILGAPASLEPGQSVQLGSQVQGLEDQAVTWSLEESPAHGTMTATGRYTAPFSRPDPPIARIRATSVAQPGKSSTVTISLLPAPPPPPPTTQVTVSPSTAQVRSGKTQNFTAAITGISDQRVTWKVDGGSNFGTVSTTGQYRAPSSVPPGGLAVIRATSYADPTQSGTANIQVRPAVSLSVSPPVSDVMPAAIVNFIANVSGADDPRVTWSLSGPSPRGLVSEAGVYTAPEVVSEAHEVTLTVRSVEDPTVYDTATIRLKQSQQLAELTRLGSIGYEFAEISDQALGAVMSILQLARSLNGGQTPTTGRIVHNASGYHYEAIPEATNLEVVGLARTIRLTTEDLTGVPATADQPWPMTVNLFEGSFSGRLEIDGLLNLRVVHSSERDDSWKIHFSRTVRGDLHVSDYTGVGMTHEGVIHAFQSHYYRTEHHIVGNAVMLGGVTYDVDEDMDLTSWEVCYASPYRLGEGWHHRHRNSVTFNGLTRTVDGRVEIDYFQNCGLGSPKQVQGQVITGSLLRNGESLGNLTVTGEDGTEVGIALESGTVLFRNSGAVPQRTTFISHPVP